ncbi:MAG TPA: hypothetical protein VFP69_17260 [Streptomyces sp.]|nr:hypothetical protein [Streptomyces sp.]
MTTTAVPTPAALAVPKPPPAPAFDRHRWTEAVLSSRIHPNAKLTALVLAHCVDTAGHLPAGGRQQQAERMATRTSLSPSQVRISLKVLEMRGFIERPCLDTWTPQQLVRPVTLRIPPAAAGPASAPRPPGDRPQQ